MPSIIRASDHGGAIAATAFNYEDLTNQAKRSLDALRAEAVKEAARIVAKAQQEAEAIRRQAEQQGRQAAIDAARQLMQQELQTLLPALRQVISEIQHAKQAWLRHWEAAAVHVAAAIAKRVIRRELSQSPQIALTLIREALELAAGNAQLRIRVNPEDYKLLGDDVDVLVHEMSGLAQIEVIADAEISRGGCRVETRFGLIDEQIEEQLRRIEEELTA
jgi:flagellar assembly protein FliH